MDGGEFLDLSIYLWDLLVMGLLPLISLLLAVIFIYKINQAGNKTMQKFASKVAKAFKIRR
jgi:uncharacterized membrane protein